MELDMVVVKLLQILQARHVVAHVVHVHNRW